MRIDYREVLDFLWDTFETFSRRDCGWILAGYRVLPSERRAQQLLYRWERLGLIARQGHRRPAQFRVTAAGQQRLAVINPHAHWNKPWDGRWRVVSYDLPELRRKDRFALWQALRARKLGLLQWSVWIWPHDVEPILQEVIQTKGIPECFCGFEATRLFLCTNAEVVETAWDFEEINRQHQLYLKHLVGNLSALTAASDLTALARVARVEARAYQEAFAFDPLLPRELCPKSYRGVAVEERHQRFRATLRQRVRAMGRV